MRLINRLKNEPLLLLAALTVAIVLGIEKADIDEAYSQASQLLTMAAGLYSTRRVVTPNRKIPEVVE